MEKESSVWPPPQQPMAEKERNILVYVFLVNSNSSIADFKSIYQHNNINIIIVILYTTAESVMKRNKRRLRGCDRHTQHTRTRHIPYIRKRRAHLSQRHSRKGTASRMNDTLETYLPTYKHATTKICIMYTRLLKPFYQICHYLIISVVF